MNSLIDGTITDLEEGTLVTGTVVKIEHDEVLLDIGFKSEGVIPVRELSIRKDADPHDLVHLGDEIEALVLQKEDKDGRLVLSKKRAEYERAWNRIEEKFNSGENVEGEVIEVVKGGLILDIGLRGFLPASLVDLRRVKDLSAYLGTRIEARVIEMDRNRNNGLVHISELSWNHVNHPSEVVKVGQEIEVEVLDVDLKRERISLGLKQTTEDPWRQLVKKYPIGAIVEGTVTKLVTFGAFVDLGEGIEGLVHISEMAKQHVDDPSQVCQVGEKVQVKVMDIDVDRRRISLSMKSAAETLGVEVEVRPLVSEEKEAEAAAEESAKSEAAEVAEEGTK